MLRAETGIRRDVHEVSSRIGADTDSSDRLCGGRAASQRGGKGVMVRPGTWGGEYVNVNPLSGAHLK